jgi:type VI secretion system secreted protein Hcp
MAADNFLVFQGAATGGLLVGKATQPEGESTDDAMSKVKASEVGTFSFEIEQATTTSSGTTGASAGRAKFGEITLEKEVDQMSAPMYNACTAGAHFPVVIIAVRKSGGSHLLFLQWVFTQVFVTSVNWSGGSGEENAKETVKFKFGAMGIQYIQQKPDGTQGNKQSCFWSVLTNNNTLGDTSASFLADTSA